ncbi:MAG: hypothetical protein GTO03_02280, partial [Planctomycetales bacterium]|nr:hypothetical protein [Planctomycetales bacterium]
QLVGDSMIKGSDIGLAESQLDLDAVDEGAVTMRQPAETPQEDSGSDLSLQFEDLSGLNLEATDESEEVKLAAESAGDAGSDLEIAGDSGLSLQGSDALAGASSELDLASSEDDEDELVLGEGSGSDITAGAGDSGISLADPTDSGLSLEEPPADLDLSGSQVDESLVLGEDDMITLGDDLAGASAPTALKTDDDFLLTPLEGDDDLSESASQVIPLDEAGVAYDPSQATMLQPEGQTDLGEGLLLADADLTEGPTMIGGAAVAQPSFAGGPQPAPIIMAPAIPEAPYSIWNVLSLFCCIAMLCLTGMLMYDVVRQIWSWEEPYAVNSDLMQAILNLFS